MVDQKTRIEKLRQTVALIESVKDEATANLNNSEMVSEDGSVELTDEMKNKIEEAKALLKELIDEIPK